MMFWYGPDMGWWGYAGMGVGMVLIISAPDEAGAIKALKSAGEEPWLIGRISKGSGVVRYV